ncbi:MAG: hypothetical protein RRZ71_05705 [Clostridia bacterium]
MKRFITIILIILCVITGCTAKETISGTAKPLLTQTPMVTVAPAPAVTNPLDTLRCSDKAIQQQLLELGDEVIPEITQGTKKYYLGDVYRNSCICDHTMEGTLSYERMGRLINRLCSLKESDEDLRDVLKEYGITWSWGNPIQPFCSPQGLYEGVTISQAHAEPNIKEDYYVGSEQTVSPGLISLRMHAGAANYYGGAEILLFFQDTGKGFQALSGIPRMGSKGASSITLVTIGDALYVIYYSEDWGTGMGGNTLYFFPITQQEPSFSLDDYEYDANYLEIANDETRMLFPREYGMENGRSYITFTRSYILEVFDDVETKSEVRSIIPNHEVDYYRNSYPVCVTWQSVLYNDNDGLGFYSYDPNLYKDDYANPVIREAVNAQLRCIATSERTAVKAWANAAMDELKKRYPVQ